MMFTIGILAVLIVFISELNPDMSFRIDISIGTILKGLGGAAALWLFLSLIIISAP